MDDPTVVGIRWGLYLTLSAAFGVPLFALYAMNPAHWEVLRLRALVGLSAAAAMMLSLLGWMATTAAMADKPMIDLSVSDLGAMLAMPALGASWLIRMAALGVLVLATSIVRSARLLPVVATALGAVALGSLAWSGHGAAGDGLVSQLHLAADVVHLLAAGTWVGALAALALLLWRAGRVPAEVEVAHVGLVSFGRTGTIVVSAIVATGLMNSWVLVGASRVLNLPATLWGRLLLAKLVLFVAMLGLAALNRWVLMRALDRAGLTPLLAITRIRRSVSSEAGIALLVLAIVAWLGTLSPPHLIKAETWPVAAGHPKLHSPARH